MVNFGISIFCRGFKSSKCKTWAKMATARIKLLRNKREVVVKQMRRDVALLLQSKQDSTARIRVEHAIREQNIMAANEIIELFCELIVARLTIIAKQRECPADLKEGISSLIFAAPRCSDIPELLQLRTIFEKKYGKEFVSSATDLRPNCGVNRTLIEKLSVRTPTGEVKLKLMKEIAKEYQIEWDPKESERELLKPPEELLEGPTKFVSASSLPVNPVSSQDAKPNQSAQRFCSGGEVHTRDYEDTATAAKAAAESAEKAVAAAEAAAYLAKKNIYPVIQTSGFSNTANGLGNSLLHQKHGLGNSGGLSASNDPPMNSQHIYQQGNPGQVSQTTCFSNSACLDHQFPSKTYVHGSSTDPSQSHVPPVHYRQDRVYHPDVYGRNHESQNVNSYNHISQEELNTKNTDTRKIHRRHSYNVPASHSDLKFDESDRSDSDCDEEIEMERPPGEFHQAPDRSPPPAPHSHAHQRDDRIQTDDAFSYKRNSLPLVHPKLPDYDELSARLEALKFRKS